MTERDKTYLNNILDAIHDIDAFVSGYDERSFIDDKKTHSACIRMFEIMGEATKRLSEELKVENPHVEWKKMAGLRNLLIHEYEGVDLEALWQIIHVNIPELKAQLTKIITNS